MDGTIPTAVGQWAMDTVSVLLAWPGAYGWGIITGVVGPGAVRWVGKRLPGKKR